jgi:predicted ester cyclase
LPTTAKPWIPPTGKRIDLTGIDIYRVVDGKIVEQWIEQDLLGLLRQLGAVRVEHVKG